MPDVEIAPLSGDLVAGFHAALDLVARERRYLTFVEAPPLEATRRFLVEGERRGDVRLVALAAGDVVGWCDISRHAFARTHRGTLGMGVTPGARRRGIGRRLLIAALERAWASGFSRVELEVYDDNLPAIALYRKTGFVEEGIVRDAVRLDGRRRDALAMSILEPER